MNIEDTEVSVDFGVIHEFKEQLKWVYPDESELDIFYDGLGIDHEHLKMVSLDMILNQRTSKVTSIIQQPSLSPAQTFEVVIKNIRAGLQEKLNATEKDAYYLLKATKQ